MPRACGSVAYDLMYAVQTERNVVRARTHVGEVKALLGLALEYGSVSADEFERVMAQLAHVRPELFRDEPDDIFSGSPPGSGAC